MPKNKKKKAAAEPSLPAYVQQMGAQALQERQASAEQLNANLCGRFYLFGGFSGNRQYRQQKYVVKMSSCSSVGESVEGRIGNSN